MNDDHSGLTAAEAQAYYDRFGRKQDSQGFYEDPALDDLIAHADFPEAGSVFELGCGTGKLAARLLARHLSSSATYTGCDVSPVMLDLARQRLQPHGGRVRLIRSDGGVHIPLPDHSVDRVVSSYVLDLLPEADIRGAFAEAHRVLTPRGKLCLASLTDGVTAPSRIVAGIWTAVFRVRPALVGGCRPIRLDRYADAERWRIEHRRVVTPFGVPSEVLVLSPTAARRS